MYTHTHALTHTNKHTGYYTDMDLPDGQDEMTSLLSISRLYKMIYTNIVGPGFFLGAGPAIYVYL
jgi:hypothetical protein